MGLESRSVLAKEVVDRVVLRFFFFLEEPCSTFGFRLAGAFPIPGIQEIHGTIPHLAGGSLRTVIHPAGGGLSRLNSLEFW